MVSRRLLHLSTACLAVVSGVLVQAPLAAQGGAQGFCLSEFTGPVVYFTPVFDTKLNPKVPIETHSINSEFHEYLKGRFGYKNSSNRPVQCSVLANVAAAEAGKAGMKGQVPATSRQVEVEWTYQPDPAWVTASYAFQRNQGGFGSAPPNEPPDYGYCVSQPADGAVSVSAVFKPAPPVNIALWQIAFSKFLGPTMGFIGNVSCGNGSQGHAERMVKARSDGVRAAGRALVDTGWKYGDPGVASNAPAAKPGGDREPAQPPPPPPPPSRAARDFATQETPEVMALCGNDRMLNGPFDCNRVSRVVYNYRLAHWRADATPEPLAQLFTGDTLDCTECINQFANMWAASRAQSNGFPLAQAQCVGTRFAETLKAKPYPNRVKELFDAAMKACPK